VLRHSLRAGQLIAHEVYIIWRSKHCIGRRQPVRRTSSWLMATKLLGGAASRLPLCAQ